MDYMYYYKIWISVFKTSINHVKIILLYLLAFYGML